MLVFRSVYSPLSIFISSDKEMCLVNSVYLVTMGINCHDIPAFMPNLFGLIVAASVISSTGHTL